MLTEIIEKPAKNNPNCYLGQNGEQMQKDRMLGQLYSQVDKYYQNLIDTKQAVLHFGYITENNVEYAHVGIFDNETGEQIL